MIQAVIFDMDGVLIDSPKYNWQAMNQLLGEEGVKVPDENIKKYLGRVLGNQLKMLEEDYGMEKHNVEEFGKKLKNIQFDLYEKNITENKIIINFLEDLGKNGIKFALATSSQKWRVDKILELLGLTDKFKIMITEEDTNDHKPNPEVYLKAAEKLKIDPENCVVIEDAVNGIEAGKNAGMKVIALLTEFHTRQELDKADLIITSLNELNVNVIQKT